MNIMYKAWLLVILQFLFLGLLVLETKWVKLATIPALFIIVSALLLAWSIISMRNSRLRVLPQPHNKATLITSGPYRIIRHPMYTSIILFSIGLLLIHFTWMRFATFLFLLLILIVKLMYEEKLLAIKFKDYKAYQHRSFRLLPLLF